eukprot:3233260-Rhodomonas_salina.1
MGNTGSTKSSPQTDGFEEKIDHAPDGEDAWFEDESVYLSAAIATTGCICCILCVRCRSSKVDHDAAEEFTSRNAVRLMENGEEPASTAQLPTRPPPPLPGYLPSWLSAASGRRRRHEVGATEEELVCPAQSPGSRRAFAERYHRRASHRAEYPPLGYVLQASTPDSSIPNSATPQVILQIFRQCCHAWGNADVNGCNLSSFQARRSTPSLLALQVRAAARALCDAWS